MSTRKIIHIDMDAFYSSIEQRDNPSLKGKPVVIARDTKERGVVTTCSYEARKYGIYSSMPTYMARKLCPHAIFIPPRLDYYKKVSQEIMEIYRRYTDVIEPIAFDEAFLDVTTNYFGTPSATIIAKDLQRTIYREIGITSSAGVSYNKFLSKIASDVQKPCGLTVVPPDKAAEFIKELPISKFFGVGKVTEKKMNELGIYTGEDLLKWSEADLIRYFNKRGYLLYRNVRGQDDSPVVSERKRKSMGKEFTFHEDVNDEEVIFLKLRELTNILSGNLNKQHLQGSVIKLKVRYGDFSSVTKQKSRNVRDPLEIYNVAIELWDSLESRDPIRNIGIYVSHLHEEVVEEEGFL
ncbi:DNA polymerase IV [Lysinibacillus alkalisoli]|uniref:DNA polymerase IV n=1 Tax=Lysinibacillus alkalisoli TaxID=1911548 RepID=A0A917GAM9_9BACI|nr:DNA polymerase IV [Lysinibacillus alkalisoli]GGG33686.1 DNA polymerase IV [Lysinibacillus alkalisoli]